MTEWVEFASQRMLPVSFFTFRLRRIAPRHRDPPSGLLNEASAASWRLTAAPRRPLQGAAHRPQHCPSGGAAGSHRPGADLSAVRRELVAGDEGPGAQPSASPFTPRSLSRTVKLHSWGRGGQRRTCDTHVTHLTVLQWGRAWELPPQQPRPLSSRLSKHFRIFHWFTRPFELSDTTPLSIPV